MLKAVIFDMDGVIIDSEPAHLEVNKILFKQLGLTISEAEYNTYIGVSNPQMWAQIKRNHGLKQSVSALSHLQMTETMAHLRSSGQKPIPGITKMLAYLHKNNILMGLASSSAPEMIDLVLEMLDIKHYFKVTVSGQNVPNGKPAPDIFLRTAELLEICPENCVVVEDSKNGVNAAKAAGMKCIGYRNMNSGNQDISAADRITDDLEVIEFCHFEQLFEGVYSLYRHNKTTRKEV